MTAKLSRKVVDKRVDAAFNAACSNRQINIMDISKVFNVGRASVMGGDDDATLQAKLLAYVQTIERKV